MASHSVAHLFHLLVNSDDELLLLWLSIISYIACARMCLATLSASTLR